MAKFLTTRKCASEIEDLIKNSGEKLTLISPYLKLSKDFKELLNYRDRKKKVTTIIFREKELSPDEMSVLRGMQYVVLKCNSDLHAKCYLNDEKVIITSMNLYQFSMDNNKEMGVVIHKSDPADASLFEETIREAAYIEETSQQLGAAVNNAPSSNKMSVTKGKAIGYCIRTGVEIPFNVDKPLSPDAYKKWSEFSNVAYPEKFCHFSGEPSNGETSVDKPILKKYWKKAQEKFKL